MNQRGEIQSHYKENGSQPYQTCLKRIKYAIISKKRQQSIRMGMVIHKGIKIGESQKTEATFIQALMEGGRHD